MSEVTANARRRAPLDIYTVLTLIALLTLIVGIGFVWYKAQLLFGGAHPFEIIRPV